MRLRIKPVMSICVHIFIIAFLFTCHTKSIAQDLSNGRIDFIFKPSGSYIQIAIWVEDENGKYISTVFLTNFIGRKGGGNRTGNPDIDYEYGNRLSALPVWSFKRGVIDTTYGIENYYPPSSTQASYPDDIDAVSGATPGGSLQRKSWKFSGLSPGICNCWIEANKSFDTNEYHNYSYYRGQPSVVLNATINVTENPDSNMVMDYTGYGSPDGSNGDIDPPDLTITTAAGILSDMGGFRFKVVYVPQEVTATEENYTFTPQAGFRILNHNFPDPSNSSTLISYSIYQSDQVILKIYNLLGEEVKTIVNGYHQAGDYDISFNMNNLSNGIYIFKLQVGKDFIDTKKMLLLQ